MKISNLLLSLALVSAAATAQTTGVPGFNDYTINAAGGGTTTDCATAMIVPAGPVVFNLSTAPNVPVVFLFSMFCPCSENFVPLPPATGCPLPLFFRMSTQAASVHPCVPPGFPVLFSQAHTLGTI